MTFTDAAAEVLRLVGKPLHYKEITDIAIEKNLLSHVGKSPEVTMGARLAATLKKDASDNPLVRVKPGVFALREWDDKTIKSGLEPKKGSRRGQRPEAPSARGREKSDDDEVLLGGDDEAEAPEEIEVELDGESHADLLDAEAPDLAGPETAPVEEVMAVSTPAHPGGRPGAPSDMVAAVPAPPISAGASSRPDSAPAARSFQEGARRARNEEDEEEGVEAREPAEPQGPDEAMRAEAAAGAAEMFDEEEDDDQPILGGTDDRAAPQGGDQADGRRRRRRRRRGRTNGEATPGSGGLPSYTATPVFEGRRDGRDSAPRDNRDSAPRDNRDSAPRDNRDSAPRDNRDSAPRDNRDSAPRDSAPRDSAPRDNRDFDRRDVREIRDVRDQGAGEAVFRPQVIELTGGEGHALDDLAGRELSDAIAVILGTFDRNAGAVSLRQIAETAQRRGRLAGDAQLVQSQVAAAVRADNARRIAAGQRARFRLAGGRVALTDWLLSGDLARLEQEALAAVERYRDAARRAFARKLGELPGHAFVEICVLALERVGVSQLRALRRPGAPGGETHFSGILRAAADELKLAIVIRRDGREVGRERVTDLRGSLHHYGPASAGWIFTAGQMLSGAREEAAVPGTAPIALYDGLAVARLCEENDVAVLRARLPIAIPDVDLLEALRAS